MCRSVPQMPVRRILTSTSLMPMVGIGTSSNQRPSRACFFTSACIVFIGQFLKVGQRNGMPSKYAVDGGCQPGGFRNTAPSYDRASAGSYNNRRSTVERERLLVGGLVHAPFVACQCGNASY